MCLLSAGLLCLRRADRQQGHVPLTCAVAAGMLCLNALGQLLDQGRCGKLQLCAALGLMAAA